MAKHPPQNIRHRVNLLLSKLSDRDTEPSAAAELTSIALTLTPGTLTAFISAVSDTRSGDKAPLRRHSLRLLSLLPPSLLSPHLPGILTALLRRLRDPDSSVRAALIHAVRSLAAASPENLFIPAILRPLFDKLFHDQDFNSQLASANALGAALDVCAYDISEYLRSVLPRLVRLVRSAGFKPKAALLALMGGVVAAGGVSAAGFSGGGVAGGNVAGGSVAGGGGGGGGGGAGGVGGGGVYGGGGVGGGGVYGCGGGVGGDGVGGEGGGGGGVGGDGGGGGVGGGGVYGGGGGGGVGGGGGGGEEEVLRGVVRCFVEFVGSEEWRSRKEAVEGLVRVGEEERGRLGGVKDWCLGLVEARRYDKVKIVRESMNRMIEVWKEIPETDHNPSELQSNSLKENATDGSSSSPFSVKRSRKLSSRSPPPTSPPIPSVKKIVNLNSDLKQNLASTRRFNQAKNSNRKIEVSVPDAGVNERPNFEARRVLFEKNCEEKKIDGVKFGAKVAPLMENGSLEVNSEDCDEIIVEQKESDLALIRMQLAQIEKQQFTLLEILQKFIISSQNGITSLEARVNILETTLEAMSRGLAAPPSGGGAATKTCCSLPGAEFLSSRLWRRAESRYASKFLLDRNIDHCSRGKLQFATKRLQENAAGDAGTESKFGQNGYP